MKKFEAPEMEIQKFDVVDVIASSWSNPDISGEGNED